MFRIIPVDEPFDENDEYSDSERSHNSREEESSQDSFEPPVESSRSYRQVQETARILFRGNEKKNIAPLPAEIVSKILDFAECWADVSIESTERIHGANWNYPYISFDLNEASQGKEEVASVYRHPKRLEFVFDAHDQGTD